MTTPRLDDEMPSEEGSDHNVGLDDKFDGALAKWLQLHESKLRDLERDMRLESSAILSSLRDQVGAGASNATKLIKSDTALNTVINDLFRRAEVVQGLVGWVSADQVRERVRAQVDKLHEDIAAGNGNDARATLNRLLLLYMKALSVHDILGSDTVVSPRENADESQREILDNLLESYMHPYLDVIQTMHGELVENASGGSLYTAATSSSLCGAARRLQTALYVILNLSSYEPDKCSQLSYCQQLELCGAVGAMAETLPQVFEAHRRIKAAGMATSFIENIPIGIDIDRSTVATNCSLGQDELDHSLLSTPVTFTFSMSSSKITPSPAVDPGESSIVYSAYYSTYLGDDEAQTKFAWTLAHIDLVPKARLCAKGTVCSNSVNCTESHSLLEVLSFIPLAMILKCPVPESNRNDVVHTNSLCVFNHGEYKGGGTLRWRKKQLCTAMENCTDPLCLQSHSLAEVCWFNPCFRTSTCTKIAICSREQFCCGFHEEYHHTKRTATVNELGVPEPTLFVERLYTALRKPEHQLNLERPLVGESAMPPLPPHNTSGPGTALLTEVTTRSCAMCTFDYTSYYEKALNESSSADRAKYDDVLVHMRMVPQARICVRADPGACPASRSRMGALTYNPLAMVLKCPLSGSSRDDGMHRLSQCVFDHEEGNIPKGFLKEKRYLCEDQGGCENTNCVKSHSLAEVCWFNPHFRVTDCPQGQLCLRKVNCPGFHEEYHVSKRAPEQNNFVGVIEATVFVDRTYDILSKRRVQTLQHIQPIHVIGPNDKMDRGHEISAGRTSHVFESGQPTAMPEYTVDKANCLLS